MPLLYEGRCSACDAVTDRTPDGYTAVYLDDPVPEYAHPDDPHLAILAHPGETMILDELGLTYDGVARNGRAVNVRRVFCRGCGQGFEIRRLSAGLSAFGCGGCLGVVAAAAAAGAGVGLLVGRDRVAFLSGFVAFLLLVWAADTAVDRVVRWRHADRVARVDGPKTCPGCGSRQHTTPGSLRRPIPCTTCGRRAVRFRTAGVS